MTEVVHEHLEHTHEEPVNSSGMGFFLGAIVLLLFLYLLFAFGLPAFRRSTAPAQINVPSKIDVNLNQGGGQ